ncbi:MAG: S8 family serine peptidase [Flavobacteriia bacterium]
MNATQNTMISKNQFFATFIFIVLFWGAKAQEIQGSFPIIVKFKTSTTSEAASTENEKLLNDWKLNDKVENFEKLNLRNTENSLRLTATSEITQREILSSLRESNLVEYAEIDALGNAQGESKVVPSDNQYYKQWAFQHNGNIPFTTSKNGADIEMEKAWEIEQGDSNVVVAILDSGVKTDHPEFSGRIWKNYAEIPNNGIDDDSNGFVDDIQGWNFADGSNDVNDDSGHGTNIASIVGANGNNGIGFSGMDWNCKLMILKVLKNDIGYYSWWANSIYYAVDNGANVINMSLGGDLESQALNEAIQYALDHNVVVVVSMGNKNSENISYPSNYPGVIAVGATNPDDSRTTSFFWSSTSGSNYGEHISVVAPGNYIYGLSNKNNTEFDTYFGGTSQSAAFVSGLASLLIAQSPTIINKDVKDLIEKTSNDRVGNQKEDRVGRDNYYGNGRINAFEALAVHHDDAFILHDEDLFVFPNPAIDFINVHFPMETESIQVFNSFGVKVFEHTNNYQIEESIPLEENGVFFVQITARGQQVSKKVVLI